MGSNVRKAKKRSESVLSVRHASQLFSSMGKQVGPDDFDTRTIVIPLPSGPRFSEESDMDTTPGPLREQKRPTQISIDADSVCALEEGKRFERRCTRHTFVSPREDLDLDDFTFGQKVCLFVCWLLIFRIAFCMMCQAIQMNQYNQQWIQAQQYEMVKSDILRKQAMAQGVVPQGVRLNAPHRAQHASSGPHRGPNALTRRLNRMQENGGVPGIPE